MKAKITCKKAVDLISKKEEGKLSAVQRFRLWSHLAECSLCRTFSAQNKLIAKAFGMQHSEAGKLTREQKDEIVDAVLRSKPEQ